MGNCKFTTEEIRTMKVNQFYELVFEYQREGKMGRIRFPKWLRDLHRKLTRDYGSSEIQIKSQLIDILNNDHLRYCNKIIMQISPKN